MKKLLMMIGAAAVAVSANADTYTDANNITWTYVANSDGENTVTLGTDTTTPCIPKNVDVNAADIPWTFEKDGTSYTVTQVGYCAFYGCTRLTGILSVPPAVNAFGGLAFYNTRLTGVDSFGDGVATMTGQSFFGQCTGLTGTVVMGDGFTHTYGRYFFTGCTGITGLIIGRGSAQGDLYFANGCTALAGAWFKGSATVASGTQTKQVVNMSQAFAGCSALKVVLFGRHTTWSTSGGFITGATDCNVFVPADGGFSKLGLGNDSNTLIPYGAGTSLDLEIDENAGTITATPTTEERLVQVLEAAPVFKAQFGLNTRINVTNTIEATAGTITAAMLNAVEFNTMLMTFAVKTQAQLDSVLAAVPQTAMLAIDPTGARQELTLPSDRAIWVWLAGDGKYTPKIKGLMIVFH